ncbi:MAG: hypothetical protein IJ802_00230 [Kiritimatiellae bacterium]|nr:hypothetical protein [Kiritimatiellia bacterium]
MRSTLHDMGARIDGNVAIVPTSELTPRKERGGGGKASGWKLHPFFFVRGADCTVSGGEVAFPLAAVRQLCPTIAGKMNFRQLDIHAVLTHYAPQIGMAPSAQG